MNADRRATGAVCVALLKEALIAGEMHEASYVALRDAVHSMQNAEFWQLKGQERHEGKNASTDKQIRISRVALPALERAVAALRDEDWGSVLDELNLATVTDGDLVKKPVKTRLRRGLKVR